MGFSRAKALQYFKDYAWDESETAYKEVTRYQSAPGQATAYMIGQQHIKKLRDDAQKILGDKFDIRDFHYHLLSQGSSPLSHLQQSIKDYIKCVQNDKAPGCYDILNPSEKDEEADNNVVEDSIVQPITRRRRHYFWLSHYWRLALRSLILDYFTSNSRLTKVKQTKNHEGTHFVVKAVNQLK